MQKFMQTIKNKKDSMLESIKNKEGFTLIELIVVMAIIAILVLLAAPRFLGYTKDADVAAVQQDVKVLSDAALQFHVDNNAEWPAGTDATAEVNAVVEGLTDVELGVEEDATEIAQIISLDSVKDYVKSISNEDEGAYALITKGDHEGEVVYVGGEAGADGKEGIEDRDNVDVYGIGAFDPRN